MLKRFQQIATKIPLYYEQFKRKGNAAVLARGAVSSFILKVLGMGLAFGVQVVAARWLGAERYGNYVYVIAWMNFLVLLGKLGFDSTSVRFIAAYCGQQEWGLLRGFLNYSSRIIVVASVGAAFCLGFGAWLFRSQISTEVLYSFWIASAMLPAMTALTIQESRLLALRKVWQAQLPQVILRPLFLLIGLALLTIGVKQLNESIFMALTLAATVGSLGIITLFFKKLMPKEINLAKTQFNAKEWLRMSQAMVLVSGFTLILAQSDIVMIGSLVGSKETGLYTVAAKIAGLLIFPLVAINSILAPLVADLYTQQNRQELQRIVSLGLQCVFLSTLSITIVLTIWGKTILSSFGAEFFSGYPILLILIVGQLINAMAGPVSLLLNMTGYHNDATKVLAVSATLNIILNAILIPSYGSVGASVATVISTTLWNVAMAFIVWHRIKIVAVATPSFFLNKLINFKNK
ncbi:flippase [Candidatus Gracilibacteria bacterium]|nr:flippase [Candidatus Gracilibacteria bacterium]NJP18387.1 flippase [Hydrococcus sp. CRU_1_1]